MAGLCIPKSIIEKVKTAVKSGDINLEKLYSMTDEERNTIFSHYVGKDSASLVNAEFEKAMIKADKAAKADYITASEKGMFAQKAAAGEFGKKLITPEQTRTIAASKIDQAITNAKARMKAVTDASVKLSGEAKANAQLKISKLQDQIDRLNVRKEDTLNPTSDALLKKINSNNKLLSPADDKAMMSDLAKAKMGQDVSPAQGKYIVEQATKLQELAKGNKDATLGVTPEYLTTRGNLETYIHNLNPDPTGISIVKNLIEIVKNNFITSIKTPLKTAFSSLTNNPAGYIIRRLSNLSLTGSDSDFAKTIKQENWKIFRQTGSNPASMNSLDDASSVLGSHNRTDPTLKGISSNETYDAPTLGGKVKGVVGAIETGVAKAAQASHYVAINLEHNILFSRIYASTFADTLNFRSLDMAKAEGLTGVAAKARGLEIMKDAAKVEPTTAAGKILRETGQQAAMKVLNVNDTWASRFAVGTKNVLNSFNPNVPVGTLLEPFAKIPASLIENAIKTTPIGIPEGVWDAVKGKMNMSESNTLETRYQGALQYKQGIEKLIGIAGSVGIASLLASQLTPKDFRSDQYGEHFVKIGDFWINTEYFSRLAPNIAGIMEMKANKGKGGLGGDIKSFLTGNTLGGGAAGGILNVPGISNAYQFGQTALGKNPIGAITSAAESYPVPAILSDMFKSHPINRLFFGANGLETTAEYKEDVKASAKKSVATRRANVQAKLK